MNHFPLPVRPYYGPCYLTMPAKPAPVEAAPTNAVLHVPAHKQTRPAALPAQIVDTEWHALARIAA